MTSPERRDGSEWIGGMTRLSTYVTREDGEPFQPDAFVWLDASGVVLGSALFRAGEAAAEIGAFFHATTRAPSAFAPHVPARVRLASRDLADALRGAIGASTEVVCAPTPELDEIFAALAARVAKPEPSSPTYLTEGIEARAVEGLFRAAARLKRCDAWNVATTDTATLTVRIDALDLRDAPLLMVGEPGESVAMLLGSDAENPDAPPHTVLELEPRERVHPALLAEIAAHDWEVAGPHAYPSPFVVAEGGAARPPTPRELAALEAVGVALSELVETKGDLRGPITHGLEVPTSLGTVRVEISAPARPRRRA